MAGEESRSAGIERFDGRDYPYWKMQIEDFLHGKKLSQPLKEKPDNMSKADWEALDRQVLGIVRLTLSRSVAHNVAGETTTVGLMNALKGMYEKPSANNKVHLMKRLFNLKMAEGGSVTTHLNELNLICNQLASVEMKIEDEMKALILLASLPGSWEGTRTAVSTSAGKEKLKYDDVRDIVLSEEVRRRDYSGGSGSHNALNADDRGRGGNRNGRRGRPNSGSRGKGRRRSGQESDDPDACWNCGKTGHFQRDCHAPRRENNSANNAEYISDALVLAVHRENDDWILDSGASYHTTARRELLQNYRRGDFGKVCLADGESLDVVGEGDVCMKSANGSVWTLHRVRHVPSLKRNLISVGRLVDEGHRVTFSDSAWKVSRGAMTIARGQKTGTLFVTDITSRAVTSEGSTVRGHRKGGRPDRLIKMSLGAFEVVVIDDGEKQRYDDTLQEELLGRWERARGTIDQTRGPVDEKTKCVTLEELRLGGTSVRLHG